MKSRPKPDVKPMLIELLVTVFYGYAGLGAIFGIYFVVWGAARIDPNAHKLPILLRLLLWPGAMALWPVLLLKVGQSKPNTTTLIGSDHPSYSTHSAMTPTLRRSHRYIWLALAIVLPAGFVVALRMTAQPLMREPIGPDVPAALPVLVNSVSNSDLTITLRKSHTDTGDATGGAGENRV